RPEEDDDDDGDDEPAAADVDGRASQGADAPPGRLGRRRGHAATLAAPVGTAASASGVLPRVKPMAPALSPSRASDFMQCPPLYRFRVVDRLPEPPNPAAARGTLVHAALERV